MQLGFRPLAFIALGIVSCALTMTGTALPVAEFEMSYQTYRVIAGIIDVEASGTISLWELCARASARPSFCGGVTGDTCPASTLESCSSDFEGCVEDLIQAGRAFAIMSCIIAFFGLVGGGAADLAGVLPVARFVLAGVAACVFVLELIAFCMFYGVWTTTTCGGSQSLADTPGWKWGPMPYLFLVAMALSFVLLVVALVSAVLEALAAEEAAAEAGGDEREAVEPSAGPGVEGDWVWAGEWGLWWSATEALYLDHQTSRRYDPTSGLWREPGTGEWVDDVVKRSLPSGPPSVPSCIPIATAVTDGDGRAGDYKDVDTTTPV